MNVSEVRISASDARGSLRGIEIGNPPGFSSPRAARFGEASVWIDPATIRSPVVLIHEIIVAEPVIT